MDELNQLRKKIDDLELDNRLFKETDKKLQRAIQQLQASEQQLMSIQETHKRTQKIAHVGSWDWDIASDTVIWSDELFQIFRLNPENGAVSYADHPKIYTSESMKRLDVAVQHTLETGEPYKIDLEIIRGDGTNAFCVAHGLAEKNENGEIIQLYGSFQDITERKKSEAQLKALNQQLAANEQQLRAANQQLQANEQQLRAANQQLQANEQQLKAANQQLIASEKELRYSKETAERYLNIAAEIILSLDSKGNILMLNDSGYQLLGYKVGSLIGKGWFSSCLPEEEKDDVWSVFRQMMKGKLENVANYESNVITKSGEIKTILWHNTIIKDNNGIISGTLSSGEDITERKKSEAELINNEERLSAVYDNSPFPVAVVDEKDQNILYWSKSAIQLFGHDPKTTEEWYELAYPDPKYRNEVIERWKPILDSAQNSTKAVNTGEYEIHCKNGSIKICEIYAQFIPGNLIVTLNDITERKKAEEELKKIEWLLQSKKEKAEVRIPDYGDLTALNQNRTILDSVGKEVLNGIVSDYLSLLETSAAVYEKNGDYAVGIFSSDWCQFMDCSSRALCKSKDNKKALESGKWLCHESCWADASNKSIQTNKAVDIECSGGLHIYAIPIRANNEVIGSINFGYGNPPTNEDKLKEIAANYNVSLDKLKDLAQSYETRPAFIIDIAKEKLETSAKLIGNIVERNQIEEELLRNQKRYQKAEEIGHVGNWEYNPVSTNFWASDEAKRIYGYDLSLQNFSTEIVESCIPERERVHQALVDLLEHNKKYDLIFDIITYDKGIRKTIHSIAEIERDAKGKPLIITGVISDITLQKKADDSLKALNQQLAANEQQLKAANQQLLANEQQLKVSNQQLIKAIIRTEENEAMLKAAMENSQAGIAIAEVPSGKLSYVNKAALLIRDKEYDEIVKNIDLEKYVESWQILHIDGTPFETDEVPLARAVLYGERNSREFIVRRDNNEDRYVLANAAPIFNENGKQIAAIVVFLDITEKKLAEISLTKANEELKRVQGITQIGNWYLDIATNEVSWSKELYKMYGFDPALPVPPYTEHMKLFTPESWEILSTSLAKTAEKGIPYELELRTVRADNSNGWMWVRGEAVTDNSGKIVGLWGAAQDISERKNIENELREAKERAEESEEKFSTIFNMSSSMICVADINTATFKFINPAFKKVLGYDEKELLSKPFLDFIHPDDMKPTIDIIENELKLGRPQINFENRYKRKDGHYCYLAWNSFPFPEKGITYAMAYDITDRKLIEIELLKAKEKAEESEEQLKRISNSFVDGMIYQVAMPDENKRKFNYISDAVTRLYGCTPEEAKENSDLVYGKLHPDDVGELIRVEKEALRNKSVFRTECRVINPDGSIRWSYYVSQPRIINDIICWDGIEVDITKQKQIENELQKAKEKAEESDRLKSAFLANMSHEIRTPMNGILGFTDLLKEPNLSGAKKQNYIRVIESSGNRLLNTVNDLIDISKIEAGQMQISVSDVHINELIEQLYTFFNAEAEKKGLHLVLDKTSLTKKIHLLSDQDKIYSILTNLIKNAIKYTQKGRIELGCEIIENDIQFFVKDTGKGISKERLNVIFDRFIRGGKEEEFFTEGSGLGLSISKAYAEMLDGKLWVESEEGVGSQFYFTIPYTKVEKKYTENKEADSKVKSELKSQIKDLKIMIAEDDEAANALLSIHINDISKEIIHAKTGLKAIDLCRQNPDIDLILMDINMPELNGYEACKQIRKFNKDVIIIAQTAYALTGDSEKSLEAGCNAYISKPILKDELMSLIQQYVIR